MNPLSHSPRHILITTGIFPPDIGGPATYVPRIATAFASRGHEITVVTLSDDPLPTRDDYPFRVVRLRRRLLKPVRFFLTVLTLLRLGRRADVCFVNGLSFEASIANLVLGKPLVQKVVGDWAWERATNQGWVAESFEEFQKPSHSLKVKALKAVRAWCVQRADNVIVPSRYLAHWVAGWGIPEKKIPVVYNAVERVDSRRSIRLPFTSRLTLTAVIVGRLVAWKRVDQIIEATAQCEGVGLVIVGAGPERGNLEELVRARKLTGRVYFTGQRSKSETCAFMAACDLFVLNSTYEGLPHVVIEAMQLGLPVVATAVGGTREVVRTAENGVLIPPAATGALAASLQQLAAAPAERQRLAQGARQTAECFRFSTMVAETEAVLQRCMTEPGKPLVARSKGAAELPGTALERR